MRSNPLRFGPEHEASARVWEPVMESAPLAEWIAGRLCQVDPRTSESCAWYHGFRLYLRALGLAITPEHHADFLRESMAGVAGHGQRVRVLVSGAIDYSMFAHVLWACQGCGAVPEITVVDVCDTPLFLNLWYARRVGVPVSTVRSDILTFKDDRPFDFICTNSFLGQFSPTQRPLLVAQWHALLAPSGRVVTVTPVRPACGVGPVGFTPDESLALRRAVLSGAQNLRDHLQSDPEDLARMADGFAARMRVHPVRSLAEIRTLFENGGFTVEHLSSSRFEPDSLGLSGPTVSRNIDYALVIARRGPSPPESVP